MITLAILLLLGLALIVFTIISVMSKFQNG